MRFRTRLLAALGCLAVFVLLPAIDGAEDRTFLTQLRVREWLLTAASEGDVVAPLAAWRHDGVLPALAVDLRTSPPIEDAAERRRQEEQYSRCAVEWATARTADGLPTRVDDTRGNLLLLVHVGVAGLRAELAQPTGSSAVLLLPFASRWSLLPAVLAIGLAVLTRRILLALFIACFAAAVAHVVTRVPGVTPGLLEAAASGLTHFLGDALWRRSLGEEFYLRITLFVVFLFMTVGVVTQNGGVHGLVEVLQRRVRGPVSAQLAAFAAGLAVFFDDYTNCLLVGSSMRPLTDRSRVSRAKLAYIVDSTAAPVAGISVFSTWITYEMSQYRIPLALVTRSDGLPYTPDDAFEVFLASLPFRCYCVFALVLVFLVVVLRRDFGPMLAAEQRARRGLPSAAAAPSAGVEADSPIPLPVTASRRARNAVLPLAVLVLGTVVGMVTIGQLATASLPAADWTERVRLVLANARSDVALLGASIAGFLLAVGLTLGQRLLTPGQLVRTCLRSTRMLWVAFGILFLAWSLGHLCADLGTSFYLTTVARGALSATALPILLLLLAAGISFATGTSFGTMAILLPNVVVLAHRIGTDTAFTGDASVGGPALMLLCIGAVLEGSIFGDHCSPISDTTVLSAVGSQCDLLEHGTTQLPYALLAFGASLCCGYLPMVWLGPQVWPWCWLAGVLGMVAFLRLFGSDASRPAAAS